MCFVFSSVLLKRLSKWASVSAYIVISIAASAIMPYAIKSYKFNGPAFVYGVKFFIICQYFKTLFGISNWIVKPVLMGSSSLQHNLKTRKNAIVEYLDYQFNTIHERGGH